MTWEVVAMADDTRPLDDEIKRTWRSGGSAETTSVALADPDGTDPDSTDTADGTDGTDTSDSSDADGTDS
jgi:hypothetical protein